MARLVCYAEKMHLCCKCKQLYLNGCHIVRFCSNMLDEICFFSTEVLNTL